MPSKRHIFVFGSNREGRHGKGIALIARNQYGAIYGQARGLQGNSYGIVTKELRRTHAQVTLEKISVEVERFMDFATDHPELEFDVAPIGCGLAGFHPSDIAPMFENFPDNVNLSKDFLEILRG